MEKKLADRLVYHLYDTRLAVIWIQGTGTGIDRVQFFRVIVQLCDIVDAPDFDEPFRETADPLF